MEAAATWRALKKASLSEDGHFLEFPHPVLCFKNVETLSSILVNDERKCVYELIVEYLNIGYDRIIVTGTPGIGKFLFLPFCILLL